MDMQTHNEPYEAQRRKIDELYSRYLAGEIEPSDYMEERLALGAELPLLASQDRFLIPFGQDEKNSPQGWP